MDNFGDFLDVPKGPPVPSVSVYVSSTLDDFGDLRRLLQGMRPALGVPLDVHNLTPNTSVKPINESVKRAGEADLLLLLLGSRAGPAIPGDDRTRIEAEYDSALAANRDVIVFEQIAAADDEPDPRLVTFKEKIRTHHTIGTLDQLADALQYEVIHDRIVKWLNETGRTQQTSTLLALGETLVVSFDDDWLDHRINQLDRWAVGLPAPRSNSGTASLVQRANDDWNEACLAFELRAVNVMKLHLNRVVRMRPLDGEARYWLGRLLMTTAADRADWKEVLRHVEVATRVAEQTQPKGAVTGLGHLVQAKCLRHMGELDRAQRSVREALDRLGWHSETHLEACYLELVAGNISIAEDHLHDAFHRFPPSFDFVEDEVADLPGGDVAHRRVRQRLLLELRADLSAMHQFEIDVGRAINAARHRNARTERSLGFINGFTVRLGAPDGAPATTVTGDPDRGSLPTPAPVPRQEPVVAKRPTIPTKPQAVTQPRWPEGEAGKQSETPGTILGATNLSDAPTTRQAPIDSVTVKPIGNNDGVTQVAMHADDPVRLANLAQSLSTLNHTRLVDLEYQVERGFAMYAESRKHTDELRETSSEQRRVGLMVGAGLLAVILFIGLIGQMSAAATAVLAWLVVVATVAGVWWWNRGPIQVSANATGHALNQLRATVAQFEQLAGQYEKAHTRLRYYVPRFDDADGSQKLWRLEPESKIFSLVSNDVLAPHIRDANDGRPIEPESDLRLFRATPADGRSAQAERWRAYASTAALAYNDPEPTVEVKAAESADGDAEKGKGADK